MKDSPNPQGAVPAILEISAFATLDISTCDYFVHLDLVRKCKRTCSTESEALYGIPSKSEGWWIPVA
jgi:hypothetical protein